MSRPRLATIWLEGCSGCHMSLLDIDERLIELNERADIVYGPLVDQKRFPENVDVTLVEGAVGNQHQLELIQSVRARTRILVSLGDCAVSGNVPAMRNAFPVEEVLQRAFVETATLQGQVPTSGLPPLCARVRPVHEMVTVDLFVPGCPPSADTIWYVLTELLDGRIPDAGAHTRFGA